MPSEDNKNLLLALFLTMVVLVGWNYFFGAPKLEQQRQSAQVSQNSSSLPAGASTNGSLLNAPPSTSESLAPAGILLPREAALQLSPRIRIETPKLVGSINLIGGKIDDLRLKQYRESVDPNSPMMELFTPKGSKNAYYADFGWLSAPHPTLKFPNAETKWQADGDVLAPNKGLTLTYKNDQGIVFTKKIEIDEKYLFTITQSVKNESDQTLALSTYGRLSHIGTPSTTSYAVLHEGPIGYLQDKLQEPSFSDVKSGKVKGFDKNEGGWLGITDKYWAAALIPDQKQVFTAAFNASGDIPTYEAAAMGSVQNVLPGGVFENQIRLFAGAKEVRTINAYGLDLDIKKFDLMIDWGWFYFITKPMFFLIDYVYKLVGNFGLAILVVTVLLKLLFFPLANKSYISMAKMKDVQPQMKELQERFAADRLAQQQALMELYRREKINPMAGCWPVLIQIPVFFALYKVLFVTIEMRHAPFYGWIKDLASADPTNIFNLFGLLPFDPGGFLHLGIWPIIMGITMWLQMKMNPEPTDPIQKTMFAWMPLIFTFMLGSFPAGLVIYWAWNNLLSVLQQYAIMKKMGMKFHLWENIRSSTKK